MAAVAVIAAGAQASSAPSPTTVSCGETLTKSTTVANDLLNCPATGLTVKGGKITVDLNGHTVDGINSRDVHSVGVADNGPHVTIENGTITGFRTGVGLAHDSVARKLTIRNIGVGTKPGDICAGIDVEFTPRTTIVDNVISGLAGVANGINVFGSPGARVEGNRIGPGAHAGLAIFSSPKTRVIRNEVSGVRQEGIDANNASDGVQVVRNNAHGNGTAGIAVGGVKRARVLSNTSTGNGDDGLFLFNLHDSLARGNRASANYTGIHVYGGQGGVAQFGGKNGSAGNRIVGNTATKNRYAGIWVKGDNRKFEVHGNLLSGNSANGNGRAGGIAVQGSVAANRLSGNTANGNAGHGIVAARGVVDGGRNRAHGNHTPPQCVGVNCR